MADARRAVIWAASARAHLSQALSYIAEDSRQGARKLLAQAIEAADSLETLAQRGKAIRELEHSGFRQLLVGRYRLIYQIMPTTVHVVAFIHGARDFERWRREIDADPIN